MLHTHSLVHDKLNSPCYCVYYTHLFTQKREKVQSLGLSEMNCLKERERET